MRSQARFVFLLLACFFATNLQSPAQSAAGELADNSHPSEAPDPVRIPEIWQLDPMTGALIAPSPSTAVPVEGLGRNIFPAAPNHSGSSSYNETIATYVTAAITKPSPGQFSYYREQSWQSNGTGWGNSAEYRMRIRGGNYGGILFSDTPTNGTLYVSGKEPFSWSIRRYEFDVLWTHEFAWVRGRAALYVASGAGAIALNGGAAESGWDKQAAFVAGAGSDVRLARFITMRVGFTIDSLKASTYGDRDYRSNGTIMVEPRIGFVWGIGAPHPQ
jgi:hypothetical protein